MARELSAALAPEQVGEIGERFVAAASRGKVAILMLDEDETLREVVAAGGQGRDRHGDRALGASTTREPAGIGTDTLPAAGKLYLPLKAPVRTRGVLVVEPADAGQLLIPEQRRLLETCAALIAIALERVHFVTVAQRTLVDMESERLRNSVLSALSHDLRTPLTALVGLSETLAQELAREPRPGTGEAKAARDPRPGAAHGAARRQPARDGAPRGRPGRSCARTGNRSRSSSAAHSPRSSPRSPAARSTSRCRPTCRSSTATAR